MKAEKTVDFQIKSSWYAISRMYNTYSTQFDMTMAIGYVLLHIDKAGTSATKIAPALGLESRSLTRMLKSLEDKKWIRREANYADKRVVKIFLTDLGKQKRDQAKQGVLIFNELIYQRIGEEKLAGFFDVIASINKILDEESDTIFESVSNKIKQ
ncbi:MarR family winged helix-turn-helix transcriptional regulator [Aquirufa sp.]|jgi:DNA-binding MarR family transcriptional regulator|uniref:MarR family winged helix-turn-helix transcriptional regulator n=1 Tax=Aquirufa sp. TaxID=2676249 RepID=UPI0037C16220